MSFETPVPPFNASDPHATYLNISCLDLLLIEMVPLAERMARRAERAERGELEMETEEDEIESGGAGVGKKGGKRGGRERKGEDAGSGGGEGQDGEVYKDAIFFRLDGLGYRVGQGLSERYVFLSLSACTVDCVPAGWRRRLGEHGSGRKYYIQSNTNSTVLVLFCRNRLSTPRTP